MNLEPGSRERFGDERILFVDDEENVLVSYRRLLQRHYQIETATCAAEALRLIENGGSYAVIVADMTMPGMDGAQLLERCRVLSPDSVRVMVTGNPDQRTAVKAVNQGQVFRFLNKPCGQELLMETLDGALSIYRHGMSEKRRLSRTLADVDRLTQQLNIELKRDLLTGLLNRYAFEEGLQDILTAASAGDPATHALCHIDLDHFHIVNQACGQLAGDALLRAVGELLTAKCRTKDLVGRVAGDDFAILFRDVDLTRAQMLAEEICGLLRNFNFEWKDSVLDTRVSIGLVPIADRSSTTAQLMSAAENACHVALDFGGGQVHVADIMDRELTVRINQAQWVTRINEALREDRFLLYAQPIVPATNPRAKNRYELLVHLRDEVGQEVSPMAFLDIAEQYHLSILIDRWVISHAVEWLSSQPEWLGTQGFCSINLSGHSIGHPDILEHIRETFAKGRVEPHNICFEITETAAIARMKYAVQFIRQLRAMGFKFALDDFGSGLSSFGYLKNLPVDYIKIDGIFIKDIHTDEIDRAMVRCITEVAKLMGKRTIAEYVANEQILKHLQEIGVDFVQGYHVGAPLPLEQYVSQSAAGGASRKR